MLGVVSIHAIPGCALFETPLPEPGYQDSRKA